MSTTTNIIHILLYFQACLFCIVQRKCYFTLEKRCFEACSKTFIGRKKHCYRIIVKFLRAYSMLL